MYTGNSNGAAHGNGRDDACPRVQPAQAHASSDEHAQDLTAAQATVVVTAAATSNTTSHSATANVTRGCDKAPECSSGSLGGSPSDSALTVVDAQQPLLPRQTTTTTRTCGTHDTATEAVAAAVVGSNSNGATAAMTTPSLAHRPSLCVRVVLALRTLVRTVLLLPLLTAAATVLCGGRALRRVVQTTALRQVLWVLCLMLMVLLGNTMQVLMLNFWLHSFPADRAPGNYTTFAVSSMTYAVFFLVTLAVYVAVKRPNLRFARQARGWRWLCGIALMDTLNSGLATYAASYTSEVLQALFMALVPVYAAVLTKLLLRDPRNYCNMSIVCSFTCIVLGVLIAAAWVLLAPVQEAHAAAAAAAAAAAIDGQHNKTSSSMVLSTMRQVLSFIMSLAPQSSPYVSSTHNHLAATAFGLQNSSTSSGGDGSGNKAVSAADRRWWALLFCLSVPPTVLMNIGQTLYMIHYTHNDNMVAYLRAAQDVVADDDDSGGSSRAVLAADGRHDNDADGDDDNNNDTHLDAPSQRIIDDGLTNFGTDNVQQCIHNDNNAAMAAPPTRCDRPHTLHRHHEQQQQQHHHGDDTIVKLVLLAGDTTLQAGMVLLLLPVDALPWFGRSASVAQAWANFGAGLDCLVHCPRNALFCLLYSLSFMLIYVGAAYLNQYSVTLCSMVSQLASPLTALVLVVFPHWNVAGDAAPWYANLLAVALLVLGTSIYVVWDARTDAEKEEGERRLKLRLLGLHHIVDNGGGANNSSTTTTTASSSSSSSHSPDNDNSEAATTTLATATAGRARGAGTHTTGEARARGAAVGRRTEYVLVATDDDDV